MATTAKQIYDAALVLMDANNDADQTEYDSKALSIINTLRGELYPYSDTFDDTVDGRPICPIVTSMTDTVGLDDYCCQTVMPHGLGAYLLMDENPSTANTLLQRYYELLADLKTGKGRPVKGSEDIEDAYSHDGNSHFYYNRFSVWGA